MTLHHPQGIRLKIHADRLELWAPVTINPPWWAFWRKPQTVPRTVAACGHENRNGDIIELRNIGTTFQVRIRRRLPERTDDGEHEYEDERVILEWTPAATTFRFQGLGQRPLAMPGAP